VAPLRVACGYAQQRRLSVACGYAPCMLDAMVATGYHIPVLVERSQRLRSVTRLRYDQLGRSRRLRSERSKSSYFEPL